MENIDKNLEYLGISGKEKEIYLAILRLKKASIIQLSQSANIKRTTVYHCLDSLIEKGLVLKISEDDKHYYICEDPELSFKSLVEENKKAASFVIPELKNIFGNMSFHPEIRVYHQTAGLKKIFEDVLTAKEKISRYYISDFNLEELLGKDFVDDFVERRIKAEIRSKSLRSFQYKPEREKDTTHAKQLREVKFVSENVIIKPYMAIYDNKVAVISTPDEKLGFIIESKEFADAQKAIFDIIWNTAAI